MQGRKRETVSLYLATSDDLAELKAQSRQNIMFIAFNGVFIFYSYFFQRKDAKFTKSN